MTQTEMIYEYLVNSTHGATLRELIASASETWPNPPKSIASSVCRLLHNSCAKSRGFKGKHDLFVYRVVGGRKIWFAQVREC